MRAGHKRLTPKEQSWCPGDRKAAGPRRETLVSAWEKTLRKSPASVRLLSPRAKEQPEFKASPQGELFVD